MPPTGLSLQRFADPALTQEIVTTRLAWLQDIIARRLERWMGYYRNPTLSLEGILPCASGARFAVRPFREYQELGLPARVTGFRRAADGSAAALGALDAHRKEVVIENDIAWRINALVDFTTGRLPAIASTAADPALRSQLTTLINALLTSAGGVGFFQELVLQGAIYGSAWIHLRPTDELLARLAAPAPTEPAAELQTPCDIARWLRLEVVEASRVCPLPGGYVAVIRRTMPPAVPGFRSPGLLERIRQWFAGSSPAATADIADTLCFDLFGPTWWQRYDQGELAEEGANPLGFVPFVRYENMRDPAAGTGVGMPGSHLVDVGVGEVEPLVGLQDELNTRLSDRACRVTMTAFKMFLGKGIDEFVKRPIGPGQMWQTDNTAATVESFGGDSDSPSEVAHIEEIREALDKISGVPPVAAGLLRAKLGNLTSAVALRLTMVALLARTERRRAGAGRAFGDAVRQMLLTLDRAGILATASTDRGMSVNWPTPLPESDMDRLTEAQAKLALGVPRETILTELGYGQPQP